jgi:RNA recognition motif-containing protein
VNIYVGNLSFDTTEDQLRSAFASHGSVGEVALPRDQFSGKLRGFGFVEMSDDGQAQAAIAALNGTQLAGRSIVVNQARPKTQSAGGHSDRGGNRGGGRQQRSDYGGRGGGKSRW